MAVTARVTTNVEATDSAPATGPFIAPVAYVHRASPGNQTPLNATSTPPVSKVVSGTVTLDAGAAELDLTGLPGSDGSPETLGTLRPRVVQLVAPPTNTGPVVLEPGDSNGYAIAGAAISIPPGGKYTLEMGAAAPQIGASARLIDLTSSHLTAQLGYLIIAG